MANLFKDRVFWIWTLFAFSLPGLLFTALVYGDQPELLIGFGILFLVSFALMVRHYWKVLRGRVTAYAINTFVTVLLVIGLLGIVNFLAAKHPQKHDFTTGKIHTLSDQTVKIIQGLSKPLKVTFWGSQKEREQFRALLDNFEDVNPKFKIDYVDPNREPQKARLAQLKKMGTLQLALMDAEGKVVRESKVEDLTEEKVTNALIKLLKDKSLVVCALTGHGERSFSRAEADGYESLKRNLTDQSYIVKDIGLQETKSLETCDALMVIGPHSAFFDKEIEALTQWLENGGRAVFAQDLNVKASNGEYSPQITSLLEKWYVKVVPSLVVDPSLRRFGQDASVPIAPLFSRDHAIAKDFPTGQALAYFPMTRPIEIVTGAPAGYHVQWLAQTTQSSWGLLDLKAMATGAVAIHQDKDKKGPLNVAVAVEKTKGEKAPRSTRLVVFGTSSIADNQFSRFGINMDLMMNSVAWVLEDESLIAIRTKDESGGKIELSLRTGKMIAFFMIFFIPVVVAIFGIVVWVRRRSL